MRKPTQTEGFRALCTIASRDGRGEALFGDCIDLAVNAYERSLIGSGYPSAYLEFPLLGEPCLDLLTVHGYVEPEARFAPNAGFGQQAMFDWFKSVCTPDNKVSCGLELDLSVGETKTAGVYLQQHRRTELVDPFLQSVGEHERAKSYFDVLERMPKGWPPAYVGLFPGRSGTPMRIGGYMSNRERRLCADDSGYLAEQFRRIGFSAFDDSMLERCSQFMGLAPSVDFQFDIRTDGTLSDTFGLSMSFNETKPLESRNCMESGYGAQLMQVLQDWGLADDRWKLVAGSAFGRHVGFAREDGTEGRFALCIRFNYAKVKFTCCEPQPAKFYLLCVASEVEA